MKKRRPFSIILYIAILAMAFSLIFGIFGNGTDNVPYSTVIKLLENGQVKSFVVEGNRIALTLHTTYDGKSELICELADVASFRAEVQHILDAQSTSGRLESYHFVPAQPWSAFELVLPLLIVGLVAAVFSAYVFYQRRD